MCGIAGIININPNETSVQALKLMTDPIAHRGPDGDGFWRSDDGRTGLGHRRLCIIDLSNAASQPMHYLNRYTIIFNGEIYNYVELKNELKNKGYTFNTASDTEVLMALYHDKKENCLQKIDGMFAFAIYDAKEKTVFCARDRFGEKPFFYAYKKNQYFIFASEIKSIRAWAGNFSINNKMLYNYLSIGALDNRSDLSETFYNDIFRLPHSHYLLADTNDISITIKKYWDINPAAIDTSINSEHAIGKFRDLFYTSVNRRLRSDVNVGSGLSGGLDSSAIVCVIDDLLKTNKAEHSFESSAFKQKIFSARFPGFIRDEGKYMQMVIDKTNVEPHFTYPTEDDLLKDIDTVAYYQDEPFSGASILVQYEIMKLAKENNVTVLLDGQGADEILAGYHEYFNIFFRQLELNKSADYKREQELYKSLHTNNPINKLQKKDIEYHFRKWMPGQFYQAKKTRHWLRQKTHKLFNSDFFSSYADSLHRIPDPSSNDLNNALYRSVMGGDLQILLRYADRNSMASSREVRLPFLSHELVEFLFTLPANFKIHEGWTKWIMRESFSSILPKEICWRIDKIGYEPPQKKWMENKEFKERIIESRKKLVQEGILDKNILKQIPKGNSAKEKGDKSWEHLMAGFLISK